jgi:hypothetical protein
MRKTSLLLAVVLMGWTIDSRAAGCLTGPGDIKARVLAHESDGNNQPEFRYALSLKKTIKIPRPIYNDFIKRIKLAAPQYMGSSSSSGPSFNIPFSIDPKGIKAWTCTDPTKKLVLTYFHDIPKQYFSCESEYRIENEIIELTSFECMGGVPHSVSAGNWVNVTVE